MPLVYIIIEFSSLLSSITQTKESALSILNGSESATTDQPNPSGVRAKMSSQVSPS